MSEFTWIDFLSSQPDLQENSVSVGIGDDAAVMRVPRGHELVMSVDTSVAGVHFPKDAAPYDIGYRALAVALSDLAAMGANPCWVALSLTTPTFDSDWLAELYRGFTHTFSQYSLTLIGGDTTQGPLALSVQVYGLVPTGSALLRSGANVGDIIFVSKALGQSALALEAAKRGEQTALAKSFYTVEVEIALGQALRDFASACIDVSDGLLADLYHICKRSQCGAQIEADTVCIDKTLLEKVEAKKALEIALTHGDDYALCFTIPASRLRAWQALRAKQFPHATLYPVGKIVEGDSVFVSGIEDLNLQQSGYQHGMQSDVVSNRSTGKR